MENAGLVAPVMALVLWTLVVWLWMYATRIPAMQKARIDPQSAARTGSLSESLPREVMYVSDNYNHLMEQPTIFYAAIAVLALAGDTSTVNTGFAWAYCGLRIVHSLWQGLVNTIKVRVALFTLSTVCLCVLAVNAVRCTLF